MAITVETDPIADEVAGQDTVTFKGWVGAGLDKTSYRLYLEPWCGTWLEILADDIVYQIRGSTTDGASVLWVKRGAIVTKCESGRAGGFAEDDDEIESIAAGHYPKK